jgi:CBS-domain-containing membrane protein
MFKRILVAYDGSESAHAALLMGIRLARRLEAELASISVEEHLPRYAATIDEVAGAQEQIEAHFRALTKQAHDTAALEGVDLDTAVLRGHEVEEIIAYAREGRFDLLIQGAHGHSRIFERVIGSTSLSLARLAPCSVFIVRGQPGREGGLGIKCILVGLDGSPLGRLAFRTALDLAILWGAAVVGLTVRQESPLARTDGMDEGHVRQLRSAAEEHARASEVAFEHHTRAGHAAQILKDEAWALHADLIVLGATGLERPWSPTIGGTASSVASEAPCSVLLVRSPQANLHASEIMVRGVSVVTDDTPLADVVELLLRRDVKALPVLDARRHLVGIITGGDLLTRGDLRLRLSIKQELEAEALGQQLRALAQSRKAARDVMTGHVRTVSPDADLGSVIRLMATHRVKRLPVVSEARELVGIVSRADVLRAVAALPEPAGPIERPLPAVGRTVADAVITEVPVVPPTVGAEEVLAAVLSSPLRRVVVANADGKVVGLISDRDLLARSGPDAHPWIVRVLRGQGHGVRARPRGRSGALTASALMAPALITVRPEDTLGHAIRLMMQHRVKRLIVVDAQGRLQGLIDRREILRLLAMEIV